MNSAPNKNGDKVFFPFALGMLLCAAGISVFSAGGVGIQPLYIVCILSLARSGLNLKINVASAFYIFTVFLSYSLCFFVSSFLNFQQSILMLYFEVFSLSLVILALQSEIRTKESAIYFARGIVFGAVLSSIVAMIQAVVSDTTGTRLFFANNPNFSIISPLGRGAGFMPEPSMLSVALGLGLNLALLDKDGWTVIKRRRNKIIVVCTILLGILATRATGSVVFIGSAALVYLLCAKSPGRAIISLIIIGLAAAVVVPTFLGLYEERLARSDANLSAQYRYEKILTGLAIWRDNFAFGSGIGSISDTDFFMQNMIYLSTGVENTLRQGVDSEIVRVLAETGTIGFVARYWPLLCFLPIALKRRGARPILAVLLAIPVLFSMTALSGYRDAPLHALPIAFVLMFFAAGGKRAVSPFRVVSKVHLQHRFRS